MKGVGIDERHLERSKFHTVRTWVIAALAIAVPAVASATTDDDGGHGERSKVLQWIGYEAHTTSRISDEAVLVVNPDEVPDRPRRIEFGNPFVGTGPISKGFVLPTGAVWTPSLLVWGNHRTALQLFDTGRPNPRGTDVIGDGRPPVLNHTAEWANRMDVYANLILSGTERVLVGFRPFDEGFFGPNPGTGRFTGYYFNDEGYNPSSSHGDWKQEFSSDLITLFAEFDVGEMLPRLDPEDELPLDISVTIGRQQFFYQEGILIFDFFDGVGITKNSIRLPGTSNLQVSFLYGWNEINRGDNFENKVNNLGIPQGAHRDLGLYGLFFAVDHPLSTVNLDLVFVDDRDKSQDGFYTGLSFVQRIGRFATAFRVVASVATQRDAPRLAVVSTRVNPNGSIAVMLNPNSGPTSAVDTGVVMFAEIGYTPAWTHNGIYATFFWAIDNYTPAARMPGTGGPMGRAGLAFAGQGLGRYAAPVFNFAQDAVGGAIGYQMILDGAAARRQLILEASGRHDTGSNRVEQLNSAAILGRFQQAIGQHVLLQLDLMGRVQEERSPGWGGRVEVRYNF